MIDKKVNLFCGAKVVIVKRHIDKFEDAERFINTPIKVHSAYSGIVYVTDPKTGMIFPQGRSNLRMPYKRELK